MYAIIRTGGKQYRVQPGDRLRVEKLEQNLGSTFDINDVLFVGGDQPQMGTPLVKGATVSAVVTHHGKDKKVLVFKKKRRKSFRRMKGHRQPFTELFISAITTSGGTVKADTKPHIIDPEKQAKLRTERQEKRATESKEERQARAEKRAQAQSKKVTKKKAAKKKTAAKKGAKSAAKKGKKKSASKK